MYFICSRLALAVCTNPPLTFGFDFLLCCAAFLANGWFFVALLHAIDMIKCYYCYYYFIILFKMMLMMI